MGDEEHVKSPLDIIRRPPIKVGPLRLTRYEKARVIAARALQLSLGAYPLISKPDMPKDPIDIAKEELKAGVLPMTLVRRKPNGEEELIPVNKIIELEKKIFGEVKI